jgi:hypothetical protein
MGTDTDWAEVMAQNFRAAGREQIALQELRWMKSSADPNRNPRKYSGLPDGWAFFDQW